MNDGTLAPAIGSRAPWSVEALGSFLNSRSKGMPVSTWNGPDLPNAIALTAGVPDPETLPVEQLLEATRTVLAREAKWALEYGGNFGYPGLRELVADRVDHQPGLGYTAENVTLTSGSAHALQNIFDTFIDAGDSIIVEAPAWGGVIRTLRGFGARMEEVALDEEGIIPEDLDQTIARLTAEGRKPKLIYTIPTFQNPMGTTATLDRRKQMIEIAARHQVLILEDDPYGELRFGGERVPSVLTLSGGDGVIRCGTFSKIIATGLRVGWIIGAKPYIDACTSMRFDNGTNPFVSRIIAAYVEAGYHEPHVAKMSEVYRAKSDAMISALDETCSKWATWTHPDGGFFVWMTLKDSVDPKALVQAASAEGVQYVTGTAFYPNGGGTHNVRLAYSYVSEAENAEAIRRLARAIERASR